MLEQWKKGVKMKAKFFLKSLQKCKKSFLFSENILIFWINYFYKKEIALFQPLQISCKNSEKVGPFFFILKLLNLKNILSKTRKMFLQIEKIAKISGFFQFSLQIRILQCVTTIFFTNSGALNPKIRRSWIFPIIPRICR